MRTWADRLPIVAPPDEDSLLDQQLRVPAELSIHRPPAGAAGPRDPSLRRAHRHGGRPEDRRHAGGGVPVDHARHDSVEPAPLVVHARHRRPRVAGLLAVPRPAVGSLAEAARPRRGNGARVRARAAPHSAHRLWPGAQRLAGGVPGDRSGAAAAPRGSGSAQENRPRRAAADAAALLPLASGRPRPLRAPSGHQEHRRHRQLGSPDDEGAVARGARSCAGVERRPETRGDRAARRPRGADPRHRVAGLRPLVRHYAFHQPRAVLRPDRPGPRPPDAPVSVLFVVHRAVRSRVRAPVGGGHPRVERCAPAPRGPAGTPASAERRAVARRGSGGRVRPGRGVAQAGSQSDWRRGAIGLFRLDVPRRRGGRGQHERHDRVGHHRPAGLCRAGRGVCRHAGRYPALPAPQERGRRAAAPVVNARRARRPARASAE